MIGPTLGGRQGALVGQPVWSEPYNVSSWRAYSDADGGYVEDVTTSVTCSCPGAPRSAFILSPLIGFVLSLTCYVWRFFSASTAIMFSARACVRVWHWA